MRTSYLLLISLTVTIFATTQSRQKSKLCAPTYYIATDADFKALANEMRVRGLRTSRPARDSALMSTILSDAARPNSTKTQSQPLTEMGSLK